MATLRHIRIAGLAALFSFVSFNLTAQSFTFETPKKYELNIDPASWKDATIYFKNTGDQDLVIEWTVLSNTLVNGWDYSLCDNGQCYIGIPAKSETAPLPPEDKGFFKLAVSAENINGQGDLVILMTNKDNPDEKDTIAFTVNVGNATSIAEIGDDFQLSVYPNPARDKLFFVLPSNIKGAAIVIFNTNGQQVLHTNSGEGLRNIQIAGLSPGVYSMHVISKNGMIGSKLFIKE